MKQAIKYLPLLFFLILTITLFQFLDKKDDGQLPSALLDKQFPSFYLPKLESEELVSQKDFIKSPYLLNVWATWWSSCVAEFPFIRDLENKYQDDLNVIFVSGDWLEQEEDVIKFLKKMKITDELFIKDQPDEEFINGIHLEWTGTLPFTIVFGKLSGSIVDFWENSDSEERFIKAVERAIML